MRMISGRAIAVVGAAVVVALGVTAAACGSSTTASTTSAPTQTSATATTPATTAPPATTTASTASQPGALTGEAASASAGDIPDNQVFLKLNDKPAGFSMKYPEGWARKSKNSSLTIADKNNIVRVAVTNGAAPTVASVAKQLQDLKAKTPSLKAGQPTTTTVSGAPSIKVTYTTVSAANPVTGTRVTLSVDRYYLWHNGRVAVLDLGTPLGVDNVDAYRLMSESFTWNR